MDAWHRQAPSSARSPGSASANFLRALPTEDLILELNHRFQQAPASFGTPPQCPLCSRPRPSLFLGSKRLPQVTIESGLEQRPSTVSVHQDSDEVVSPQADGRRAVAKQAQDAQPQVRALRLRPIQEPRNFSEPEPCHSPARLHELRERYETVMPRKPSALPSGPGLAQRDQRSPELFPTLQRRAGTDPQCSRYQMAFVSVGAASFASESSHLSLISPDTVTQKRSGDQASNSNKGRARSLEEFRSQHAQAEQLHVDEGPLLEVVPQGRANTDNMAMSVRRGFDRVSRIFRRAVSPRTGQMPTPPGSASPMRATGGS